MDRKRAKELLPIIQAFADGKEIEFRDEEMDYWEASTTPRWLNDVTYRVKPVPREFNLWVHSDGRTVFPEVPGVHIRKDLGYQKIRVREVMEQ